MSKSPFERQTANRLEAQLQKLLHEVSEVLGGQYQADSPSHVQGVDWGKVLYQCKFADFRNTLSDTEYRVYREVGAEVNHEPISEGSGGARQALRGRRIVSLVEGLRDGAV